MRWMTLGLTVMGLSAAALAAPPYANELMLPMGGIKATDEKAPPKAMRGQFIGVACAKVELAAQEAIQVVMYLAPNETPTGYQGVVATDHAITKGTVHVRVPDTPDIAQHTVRVKVYYSDAKGRHSCDGGTVRIV